MTQLNSSGITFPNGTTQTSAAQTIDPVKVWVNFNGTGAVSIRASLNVSSITDNGVGDYTVNFSSSLADASYAVAQTNGVGTSSSGWGTPVIRTINANPTASTVRVGCLGYSSWEDSTYVCVTCCR